VAEGFVSLFTATGDRAWLEHAGALLDTVREQFRAGGGLFDTAAEAAPLYFRPSDPTDNASPSGTSAAAAAFAAYAQATGSDDALADAHAALGASRALALQAPRFAGYGLAVGELLVTQ